MLSGTWVPDKLQSTILSNAMKFQKMDQPAVIFFFSAVEQIEIYFHERMDILSSVYDHKEEQFLMSCLPAAQMLGFAHSQSGKIGLKGGGAKTACFQWHELRS